MVALDMNVAQREQQGVRQQQVRLQVQLDQQQQQQQQLRAGAQLLLPAPASPPPPSSTQPPQLQQVSEAGAVVQQVQPQQVVRHRQEQLQEPEQAPIYVQPRRPGTRP